MSHCVRVKLYSLVMGLRLIQMRKKSSCLWLVRWKNCVPRSLTHHTNNNKKNLVSLCFWSCSDMVKLTKAKTFQAYLDSCHRRYSCVHCRAHLANHDDLISKVCMPLVFFVDNHVRCHAHLLHGYFRKLHLRHIRVGFAVCL